MRIVGLIVIHCFSFISIFLYYLNFLAYKSFLLNFGDLSLLLFKIVGSLISLGKNPNCMMFNLIIPFLFCLILCCDVLLMEAAEKEQMERKKVEEQQRLKKLKRIVRKERRKMRESDMHGPKEKPSKRERKK